jgi:hypothetical protein
MAKGARIATGGTSRYPRAMVSKPWTWSTVVAVIFAGLTNAHAHVHYCFDGQEPPATVHLVDATDHDHDHEPPGVRLDGAEHDDLDVDVPNQALTKSVKYDSPAIASAFFSAVPPATPRGTALARYDASPPAPDPHHRRPPTRGPPA